MVLFGLVPAILGEAVGSRRCGGRGAVRLVGGAGAADAAARVVEHFAERRERGYCACACRRRRRAVPAAPAAMPMPSRPQARPRSVQQVQKRLVSGEVNRVERRGGGGGGGDGGREGGGGGRGGRRAAAAARRSLEQLQQVVARAAAGAPPAAAIAPGARGLH